MPVTGRKPTDGPTVNHVPPVHEWREIIDVPFRGSKPALPKTMPAETKAWWRAVTALPHCILWHDGDWRFALDTARVHAEFVGGDMARAAELRLRERAMGTTTDALKDLRIRYVPAPVEAPATEPEDAVNLAAERRKRLTNAS
jgi:hypothetical protein